MRRPITATDMATAADTRQLTMAAITAIPTPSFVIAAWFARPTLTMAVRDTIVPTVDITAAGDRRSRAQSGITMDKKKRRPRAPLLNNARKGSLRCFRFLFLHRARIQALGIDIAVDELDHGHRRVVAVAEAGLDDAGVTALAVLVAGRQRVEQLADLILVAHLADRLAAHGQPALLAEGNKLFDDRAQFLRLRQRGDDLLVLDQRGAHVGEHRLAMLGGAVELTMNLAVTHRTNSSCLCVATVRRTLCSGGLPAFAQKIVAGP